MFDEFDGSFAGEGDSEDVSQFEDEKVFGSRVFVQILFADSWSSFCRIGPVNFVRRGTSDE